MTKPESLLDSLASMRPQDRSFFHQKLSRRAMVRGGATVGAGYAVSGLFSGAAAMPQTAFAGNSLFRQGTPPPDAAPPENQVLRVVGDPNYSKVLDFYEQVYERPSSSDLFSLPLVRLNKNFEIIPGAATDWSGNDDGTTWTFKLKEGMMWSDGNPVTALDYVRTFQYSADPEHAWDFTWFWSGNILNYTQAVAGEVPVDEIGVRQGANEYEVVFETTEPAPYLVSKLLYSTPLSAAALDEHGPLYNTNPETQVSSGPFKLEEWARDERIVYTRNETFTEYDVMLEKIIIKIAAPSTAFTLYEADQIDYMVRPAPAELQIMESDPELAKQIYQGVGDFACLYFFFDVNTAPFDDLKVRQAFSHVIDREAIQQQILGRQAKSAPSFLAPGFPASNTEELASIQNFDPELGKKLLAEAGYPDGEGFPDLTLTVRGGAVPIEEATTQAYAAMLNEHLNIKVELQTLDRQAFYDAMNAKPTEILFGWVSYGMDYFDPSNMLGVWLSGGRHSWSNEEYDRLVNEATTSLEDEDTRTAMFQDAERILVEDVPAVWAYFETPIQLVKPYVIGPGLDPDVNDITAVHWPEFVGFGTAIEEIYISADAPTNRT
jgi:peptide/nickel transport system substrate-binding protein/oligopeptide transport system substrate-binding protein